MYLPVSISWLRMRCCDARICHYYLLQDAISRVPQRLGIVSLWFSIPLGRMRAQSNVSVFVEDSSQQKQDAMTAWFSIPRDRMRPQLPMCPCSWRIPRCRSRTSYLPGSVFLGTGCDLSVQGVSVRGGFIASQQKQDAMPVWFSIPRDRMRPQPPMCPCSWRIPRC